MTPLRYMKTIMRRSQRRQRVAAGVNEGLHARFLQGFRGLTRPACQIDMYRAGGRQRFCGLGRLLRINLV